jgi:hypothetical protein
MTNLFFSLLLYGNLIIARNVAQNLNAFLILAILQLLLCIALYVTLPRYSRATMYRENKGSIGE